MPLKTSRRLIDRAFQQADKALKGAERRPTAQKGGAHAPPVLRDLFALKYRYNWLKSLIIFDFSQL